MSSWAVELPRFRDWGPQDNFAATAQQRPGGQSVVKVTMTTALWEQAGVLDRIELEGAAGSRKAMARRAPVARERFQLQFRKSRMCRFYVRGECAKGEQCMFAHGLQEVTCAPDLRKTSLCPDWQSGRCPLSAEACLRAHGPGDLHGTPAYLKTSLCKQFLSGRCHAGKACRHAHGDAELETMQEGLWRSTAGSGSGESWRGEDDAQEGHLEGPQGLRRGGGLAAVVGTFPLPCAERPMVFTF